MASRRGKTKLKTLFLFFYPFSLPYEGGGESFTQEKKTLVFHKKEMYVYARCKPEQSEEIRCDS